MRSCLAVLAHRTWLPVARSRPDTLTRKWLLGRPSSTVLRSLGSQATASSAGSPSSAVSPPQAEPAPEDGPFRPRPTWPPLWGEGREGGGDLNRRTCPLRVFSSRSGDSGHKRSEAGPSGQGVGAPAGLAALCTPRPRGRLRRVTPQHLGARVQGAGLSAGAPGPTRCWSLCTQDPQRTRQASLLSSWRGQVRGPLVLEHPPRSECREGGLRPASMEEKGR